MKVLILVLSSDTYPSKRNSKVQKNTWAKELPDNFEAIHYKSGNKTYIKENDLIVKAGKKTNEIGYKNFRAFEWVLENKQFDYLFRTNTSSYINISELEKFIKDIDKGNSKYIYSGKIINLKKSTNNEVVQFVSGAGILLSKNSLQSLVDNQNLFDHNEWEDVGIGKLFNLIDIFPTDGSRFDIRGNIFKLSIPLNEYHYRCRIDNHYNYPRFLETTVIKELHKRHIGNFERNNNFAYKAFFEICKFFYINQLGWKIFSSLKRVAKLILPNKIYKQCVHLFKNIINNFYLSKFKK